MFASKISTFFAGFVLLCVLGAYAQDYSYVQYNVQNGLAGSTVYDAVQDKDGFVWFATESGVSRFDGTSFKNFSTKDGLPDDEVLKLFVDSRNRVWMIPFNKTICYYSGDKFHTQSNDSTLKSLQMKSEIISIAEDMEGNILLQEATISHILNARNFFEIAPISDDRRFILFGGTNNSRGFKIGVSTVGNLSIFSMAEGKYRFIRSIHYPPNIRGMTQQGLLSDKWEIFKIEDSIHVYSCVGKKYYNLLAPQDLISFSAINDSIFFMNTRNGSYSFSNTSNIATDAFLKNHSVSSVFRDNENNYWFTTFEDGVFRLPNTQIKIALTNNQASISFPIYSMEQDKTKIYAGSNNANIFILDKKKESITDNILLNKLSGRVMAIRKDSTNGILYIGTDHGLLKRDHQNESILVYSRAIKSIELITEGLLAASNANAFIYDNTKKVEKDIWPERSTVCSAVDNNIYVGTITGLFLVKGHAAPQFLGNKYSMLKNRITDISVSNQKVIWIATDGKGIIGLKGENMLYSFNSTNGLSSNNCKSLYCQGNIVWAGTDKGLNKITISGENFNIVKFDINDGFPSNIINTINADSSIVYLGTPKGLVFFNESKLNKESKCLLKMLKTTVGDKEISEYTIQISLKKKESINFEFVGISFKSAGDILYKYKLIGFDTVWRETKQNNLHFLSLPSGSYQLQLLAINKFGVQSKTIFFPFTVEKDFIEKTWVRIGLLLAMALGFWVITIFILKQVRKRDSEKIKIQERMMQLEQMALKSQMNPHFIFNSLNSIQQYVIDKDIAGANKYISGFSRLIRQTLDNSSKESITLAEEIGYLTNFLQLEKSRMENAFEYSIIIPEDIDTGEIHIPPMLLQPYIENSIRHGIRYRNDKKGKIDINIFVEYNELICTITDNGIGRKLSNIYKGRRNIEYQSKGTALTAERINIINASNSKKIDVRIEDLEDELQQPLGTKVIIRFPIDSKEP